MYGGEARSTSGAQLYIHVNGSRGVFVSTDHASSFEFSTYEQQEGYRQVYSLSPLQVASSSSDAQSRSSVLLGAHAGVYLGDWPAEVSGSSTAADLKWTRAVDPAGTISGLGDQTDRVGGCRGAAASPDGQFVYAVYQLDVSGGAAEGRASDLAIGKDKCVNTTTTAVYVARTQDLRASASTGSDPWTRVSSGLDHLYCTEWAFPRMDPRSNGTVHRLALGIVAGLERSGLAMADMRVPAADAAARGDGTPAGEWYVAGNGQGDGFNMTMGWEYRSWKPFAFDFFPLSWNQNLTEGETTALIASGSMNLMRSRMDQPGWPKGAHSWINVYTHEPPRNPDGQQAAASLRGVANTEPAGSLGGDSKRHTWAANGFTSTYVYDLGASGNYAVSCQADHGIVESFDGGRSWTQFNYKVVLWPDAPSRCTSTITTPAMKLPAGAPGSQNSSLPVVLLHGGVGYGASGDRGCLLAKPLVTGTINDKAYRIAGGHNSYEVGCTPRIAGLPNRNMPAMAMHPDDPKHLLVSTEQCGLYETKDFTGLLLPSPAPSSNFSMVQAINADLSKAYFSEVVVVPERDALLASWNTNSDAEKGLWELKKLSNGSYNATRLPYAGEKGLSSWRVNGGKTTRVVYPTNGETGVVLSIDGGATFTQVLDIDKALELRKGRLPWYNATLHREHIIFSAGAGEGDTVVVACWVTDGWNKGIGVYKGTITAEEGSPVPKVAWEDWSGSPEDTPPAGAWPSGEGIVTTYMYDAKSGRARVLRPDGEGTAPYYYIASESIGGFRRKLN